MQPIQISRKIIISSYHWDVSKGVEADGLVSSVVTGHVALAAVDAHLRINQGDNVLPRREVSGYTTCW